jgi:hypothetical protein
MAVIRKVEEGLEIYKKAVREYLNFIQPYVIAHGNDFMGKISPLQKFVVNAELSRLTAMGVVLDLTEDEMEKIQQEVMDELAKVRTE